MNTMNCSEFQNQLILNDGNAISHEARQHLTSCRECQNFAYALAMTATDYIHQDDVALKNCHEALHATQRKRFWQTAMRSIAGCAAALVLLLGLLHLLPLSKSAQNQVASSTFQNSLEAMYESEEYEINWRGNLSAIDDELNFMESNLTLLACGL